MIDTSIQKQTSPKKESEEVKDVIEKQGKMQDSVSTNFQWQKAFSKGDQALNVKQKNFSLEQYFID